MLKIFILIANLFFCSSLLFAQMVLKYKTTFPNEKISLPLNGTVNVTVDWGDGSAKQAFTEAGIQTHSYVVRGLYTVNISGTLSWFGGDSITNFNLISVESWEGLGLTSLSHAFYDVRYLTSVPNSLPTSVTDLSFMFYKASSFNQNIGTWNVQNVTNMKYMLASATKFNQPIGAWNTENVTDMSSMFYAAISFDQSLGAWNTANVTDMNGMFYYAGLFNQPIGEWNTSRVTDMSKMFYEVKFFDQPLGAWNTASVSNMSKMFEGAGSFNQPIGAWNTENVTDMSSMFYAAGSFNQPIGTWNTGKVINMESMFRFAGSFNQPIGSWNTGKVANMGGMFSSARLFNQPLGSWNTESVAYTGYMFYSATSFNQPIGNWKIDNVSNMTFMFSYYISLCTDNYDNLLNGWASQAVKSNVLFSAGESKYSTVGESARTTLITKGWTIMDGGQGIDNTKCPPPTSVEDLQDNTISQEIKVYPNPSGGIFTVSGKVALGNNYLQLIG